MTKEQWIQIRDQFHIPIEVWFDYYRERGGSIQDLQTFTITFYEILPKNHIVQTNKWTRKITFETAVKQLFEYYNNKFDL